MRTMKKLVLCLLLACMVIAPLGCRAVMVGSSAVFMRMFKLLPDSALIDAYADRCLARPAYQRAMKLDAAGDKDVKE